MEKLEDLPPNTVRACLLPGLAIDPMGLIKPCTAKSDWMDGTHDKYAYRCIPLVSANTMGWELFNPVASEARWNGGDSNADIEIRIEHEHPFAINSHFGSGMVTWYLPFLFRTSPDLGLIVTGPANHAREDAVPLDAFVRTDWLPFPFTMNWRLTRKDRFVKFAKNEPICRILPYPIALLNETQLEITNLADDPGFMAEVNAFGAKRQENVAKQQEETKAWLETGKKPSGKGVWNSQYVRAKGTAKEGFAPHQTVFSCAKPQDRRK